MWYVCVAVTKKAIDISTEYFTAFTTLFGTFEKTLRVWIYDLFEAPSKSIFRFNREYAECNI